VERYLLALVIVPAQQHLTAADLAVAVALGLHQDAQLLARDGLVQRPVQHQPLADLAAEGGGVGPQLAPALALGLHQGRVGALQQGQGGVAVLREAAHPHAHGGPQGQLRGEGLDGVQSQLQLAGALDRLTEGVHPLVVHHAEFIAAQASHPGIGREIAAEQPGETAEQLVTRVVTEGVVDFLEPIDVQAQHRQVEVVGPAAELFAQPLEGGGLVGELGERVP